MLTFKELLIQSIITEEFMYNTGNHPSDLRLQNYGIWKHPVI